VDLTKTVTTNGETPDDEPDVQQEELSKVFIGKVPIMLRSAYCSLYDHTDKELAELGECPYDQVGSFLCRNFSLPHPLTGIRQHPWRDVGAPHIALDHRLPSAEQAVRQAAASLLLSLSLQSLQSLSSLPSCRRGDHRPPVGGGRWRGQQTKEVMEQRAAAPRGVVRCCASPGNVRWMGSRERAQTERGDVRATIRQGGYFVINGSEKCLIAQEKMSNNHVYVFEKRMPCKYSFTAECRCAPHPLPPLPPSLPPALDERPCRGGRLVCALGGLGHEASSRHECTWFATVAAAAAGQDREG
jgi:DNA-directed RNA polymerase beta subunit